MKKKVIFLITFTIVLGSCSKNSTTYSKETTLLCLGDILTAKAVEKRIMLYGYNYPFKKTKSTINSYDAVFANLETPISNRGEAIKEKKFTFEMSPSESKSLKSIKLSVVSLENNHLLDYGKPAMIDTLSFLKKNKIMFSGAGNNIIEARKPAKISKNGTNYLFLSYCERPPATYHATETKFGTAPLDINMIIDDIKKYKSKNNVILISLHWGIEQSPYPRKDQIKMAHKIIDAGADGIIGHHPHVPQGIEIYKNHPIIYSLGNFIIGYYNSGYRNNMAVSLHYKNNKLSRLEILPVAGKNREMEFQPFFLKNTRAKKEITYLTNISKQFKTKINFKCGRGIIEITN